MMALSHHVSLLQSLLVGLSSDFCPGTCSAYDSEPDPYNPSQVSFVFIWLLVVVSLAHTDHRKSE